jgi:hypothetical protein
MGQRDKLKALSCYLVKPPSSIISISAETETLFLSCPVIGTFEYDGDKQCAVLSSMIFFKIRL